jgi:hypothetical protein
MKTGNLIAKDNLYGWVEDSFGALYKFPINELIDNRLQVGHRVIFESLCIPWAMKVESATEAFIRYKTKYGNPE